MLVVCSPYEGYLVTGKVARFPVESVHHSGIGRGRFVLFL